MWANAQYTLRYAMDLLVIFLSGRCTNAFCGMHHTSIKKDTVIYLYCLSIFHKGRPPNKDSLSDNSLRMVTTFKHQVITLK